MHYALCIFTMFFLCILQFRGSIQCIIQNMQYEVMRYENFDCISESPTQAGVASEEEPEETLYFEPDLTYFPGSDIVLPKFPY